MKYAATVAVNPRLKDLEQSFRMQPAEMATILNRVDSQFAQNERKLFASEGSSGGESWPALSPAYARFKKKAKPGRKIMVFSGKLRKSLVNKNNPLHVARYTIGRRQSVTVGTARTVAAYHIDGSPLRNPRLPERDTLQMTAAQAQGLHGIIRDYIVGAKLPRVMRSLLAWRRGGRRGQVRV